MIQFRDGSVSVLQAVNCAAVLREEDFLWESGECEFLPLCHLFTDLQRASDAFLSSEPDNQLKIFLIIVPR